MAEANRHLEENTAQLIRAAFGPEVRPDRAAMERTAKLIRSRARQAESVFWDGAAVVLAGILMVLAVWLVAVTFETGGPLPDSLPVVCVAFVLIANLVWVPIAGILIVMRRRHA
jgi:hypothetical protein